MQNQNSTKKVTTSNEVQKVQKGYVVYNRSFESLEHLAKPAYGVFVIKTTCKNVFVQTRLPHAEFIKFVNS